MAEDNTPTNVVDDVVKNKGTINEWFNEAIKEYDLVSGTPTGRKNLLRYSDFEEFLINKKGLKKETAEKIIKDIKTGVVTQIELGPKSTTGISPDFAKATGLTDVGISQNVFKDFGVQNYLDTVYTQASDLSSAMYDMSFADRQALQNTFYDSLKNSDDVIEIYLRQVSSVNVPAENVFFKSQLTQEVPGFYTEPIGGLTPGEMASGGGIKPTENFYKLEINKNNLLIDVPGVDFSNELKTKLDWNLLEKELGINYSQFKDIDSYQLFHTKLSNVANDLGIDNTKLYSTLRKSGYEGTVGYVNRQVEVVLLDPNDDLGIGKKVNFENSNVDDFYNNQSKVNQIDELIIDTPTNVVDEVSKLQDNINDYLNEIISENPSRSADLAVDPLRLTLSDDGKFIDITELVIDENYRNQGLGTEVFNRIKEFANNNNLSITTTPFVGELENLVKKQGFVKEGNQYILKLDTPGGSLGAAKLNDPLVFDSWIDNYAKTTTSFVDNLPLSTTVKNQFNNLVQGRARNLATPGGVADAVDVWELGVLGLMIAAVAYKEYDEIPTILKNKTIDMFNSMTSFYNIPPVPKEEYNLDYEFINKVVETGEKFMPTDIIIKKVGEVVKGAAETGTVTGFGYVPTTTEKADTMETTKKIQPGVQEEKMFEQAKPKKIKSSGSAGARIL